MKRLVALMLTSSAVLVPTVIASSASAAGTDCSYANKRTTCVTTSTTQSWEHVDYESGDTFDGTLTSTWCQQQDPDAVLNQYETFQTDFLVRTTRTTTTVRQGRFGKVSKASTESHRILRYTMPRGADGEAAPGDALTCSYEA